MKYTIIPRNLNLGEMVPRDTFMIHPTLNDIYVKLKQNITLDVENIRK